jgi:hypothetical protein
MKQLTVLIISSTPSLIFFAHLQLNIYDWISLFSTFSIYIYIYLSGQFSHSSTRPHSLTVVNEVRPFVVAHHHRINARWWLDVTSSHAHNHFLASFEAHVNTLFITKVSVFFLIKRQVGCHNSHINLCVKSQNQQTYTSNNHRRSNLHSRFCLMFHHTQYCRCRYDQQKDKEQEKQTY